MPTEQSPLSTLNQDWLQTIRPIGAYAIHGLAWTGSYLLALDTIRGYLLQCTPGSDNAKIFNQSEVEAFTDATGLAVWQDTLWITHENSVYFCKDALKSPTALIKPQHFVTLPYPADGIAVWESTLYVTCQKMGYILVFDGVTTRQITRFPLPGVGIENITVWNDQLWISDTVEQTVYCMDRATGELQFSVLTPFESPTALTFCPHPQTQEAVLYVAYTGAETYIRDNPNANPSQELAFRDRTLIHPLYFRYDREHCYALSNGYLIELVYTEELHPLEEVDLKDLEWRIALPSETDRQKLVSIEPVGLPFIEEIQNDQRVALFKFTSLKPGERYIFGWRAILEVWSIKYQLKPRQVETPPALTPEYVQSYLGDDDDLAMDTDVIQRAAREAVGNETNLLRKILKIRNYVYDRLSYGIKAHIDTPDVALQRGIGSCGEYLGVLLALCRLNGIACRTVGRYKCPLYPDRPYMLLRPDYNHVWMEFYIPGFGWLPMESNPDDVIDNGPYPTRFFMGLGWAHTEIGKGVSFENLKIGGMLATQLEISIGDLALNHVRYRILRELKP